jgi:3-phosphoshikimate 1-carboxyvinyltransferase
MLALVIVLAFAGAARAATDEGWAALGDGEGKALLIRHAEAPGTGDPPGFRLGECGTQRNLSPDGRAQAAALGRALREHGVRVGAVLSSQYASSLLLAAAALFRRTGEPIAVEWVGEMASAGYLELTCAWLSRSGFRLAREGSSIAVVGLEPPRDGIPGVPGDWSSIGYLLLAAWRSGGAVADVDLEAAHPDRAMARILEQVGLSVQASPDGVRVAGEPRTGLRASGRECPDLLPTLAVLACALPEPSALTDVSILRGKESDRVQGIVDLVQAAGGTVTLREDFAVIDPPREIARTLRLSARGDHRMAMSAAALAILGGSELILSGAEHVAKSFPTFWTKLRKIGVRIDESGL